MNIRRVSFAALLLLFSLAVYAQNPDSIFDEGAEEEIRPEEITDDLRLWAENTALKLKRVIKNTKKYAPSKKREILLEAICSSVTEAQGKRELLLMRFTLNRALKLEALFEAHHDALVVNYVLVPLVKQAISLYENADLPFLEANKDKTDVVIEPPAYAAFTKANIGYLLTVSNINTSYVNQFNILKLAVVWVANDLLRSTATRRNPINSDLILDFEGLSQKLESMPQNEIGFKVNNTIRDALLEARNKLVLEANAVAIKSPIEQFIPPRSDASAPISNSSSDSGFFSDVDLWPSAGILNCTKYNKLYTVGVVIAHVTTAAGSRDIFRCQDSTTHKSYDVTMWGIGLGALFSLANLVKS